MTSLIPGLLLGAALPPVATWAWSPVARWITAWLKHRRYGRRDFVQDWLWNALWQAGCWHFGGYPALSAGAGVSAVIAAVVWWWSRPGRRRARRWLGAKSRALVAALARKARESAQPRPVLRPVPEGS